MSKIIEFIGNNKVMKDGQLVCNTSVHIDAEYYFFPTCKVSEDAARILLNHPAFKMNFRDVVGEVERVQNIEVIPISKGKKEAEMKEGDELVEEIEDELIAVEDTSKGEFGCTISGCDYVGKHNRALAAHVRVKHG